MVSLALCRPSAACGREGNRCKMSLRWVIMACMFLRHMCELTSACAFSTWIFHSEGSCSRDGRSRKSDHSADSYSYILRSVKQKSSFLFYPVGKNCLSFVFIQLKLLVPIWQHLEKVSQHCANYAVTPVMSCFMTVVINWHLVLVKTS